MNTPIKVLIVDDSALVRKMLNEMLSSDPNIEVVGTAQDPYDAREKIKQLHPDVLTLDVEMPKMDGVTFLKNLMRLHPLPVVMVSTLTEKGADVTFEALDLGAVDFVTKPKIDLEHTFEEYTYEICNKVKSASRVSKTMLEMRYQRYVRNIESGSKTSTGLQSASSATAVQAISTARASSTIVALGASTGGTEAIKEVLVRMPSNAPAIVITQHIPAAFSAPFAKRMNTLSEMNVYEAEEGQVIEPGSVYIAPGDRHLLIVKEGARFVCRLDDGEPVNRHKPSVDVMFRSVLKNVGRNTVAVILTGMGADGAKGMKEMRDQGIETIAQDEKTSVVWGMPGEAVKIDAASHIKPLDKVAESILSLCK